jgi:hypothetical protein
MDGAHGYSQVNQENSLEPQVKCLEKFLSMGEK